MYDYMKSLQRQFSTKPKYIIEEELEVHAAHKELSAKLERDERRLLLRIIDMEDHLRDASSLHSFAAGYRLACGIHREIAMEPMHSFDREEERRASASLQTEDSDAKGEAT